jgi:hypothetical protein
MKNSNTITDYMIKEAYFAYLEYCSFTGSNPSKEVYSILSNDKSGNNIDSMISFIELNHGKQEKGIYSEEDKNTFSDRFIEKFKPKQRELSQKVDLDQDSDKVVEQFVNYDPTDNWILLTHDGNEISLSLPNYRKLIDLAERTLDNF